MSFSLVRNNYSDEDINIFSKLSDGGTVKCATLAYEVGKEGTKHLQCALTFNNSKSLKKLREYFVGWHIEVMKTNVTALHSYCCKGEDEPDSKKWNWENLGKNAKIEKWGKWPQQGSRTDVVEVCDEIKAGTSTPYDIMVASPILYHQYGRTFNELYDKSILEMKKRDFKTECYYITGSSGSGKTRWIFDNYDNDMIYVHNFGDKGWWDSYNPMKHKMVIFDDFRDSDVKFNDLLRIMDRYPYSVPRRGRSPLPFLATFLVFTSVLKPEEQYKKYCKGNDNIKQFLRRIDDFMDMDYVNWCEENFPFHNVESL
jgi:hypothetical protein